jgi:hypothetical protein
VEYSLSPKQEHITVIGDAAIHIASSIQRCAGCLSLAWRLYHPQPLQPRPSLNVRFLTLAGALEMYYRAPQESNSTPSCALPAFF